jgi:hypothetical protein
MDADRIIPSFVLIDTLMGHLGHASDAHDHVPDSEVILIAVVAANYFQHHHERAVCILRETRYLSGHIDVRRFKRRLHKLADWLGFIATVLGDSWARLLWLLRCQKGGVLGLALASDLYAIRRAGQLSSAASRVPRFDAAARIGSGLAARRACVR